TRSSHFDPRLGRSSAPQASTNMLVNLADEATSAPSFRQKPCRTDRHSCVLQLGGSVRWVVAANLMVPPAGWTIRVFHAVCGRRREGLTKHRASWVRIRGLQHITDRHNSDLGDVAAIQPMPRSAPSAKVRY